MVGEAEECGAHTDESSLARGVSPGASSICMVAPTHTSAPFAFPKAIHRRKRPTSRFTTPKKKQELALPRNMKILMKTVQEIPMRPLCLGQKGMRRRVQHECDSQPPCGAGPDTHPANSMGAQGAPMRPCSHDAAEWDIGAQARGFDW